MKKFTWPRMRVSIIVSVLMAVVLAKTAPHLSAVTLYKFSLVTSGGVAGYFLDRELFPYARPDGYLLGALKERYDKACRGCAHDADYPVARGYELIFAAAMLRRALIVGCLMLAVGLGA